MVVSMGCCRGKTTEVQLMDGGFERKKGCTDCPWIILFVAFMGGMGYVIYLCLAHGDPNKLIYGLDSWGNTCNVNNTAIEGAVLSGKDLTGLANLFYYNFLAVSNPLVESLKICVKSCPNVTVENASVMWNLAEDEDVQLCRYDVTSSAYFALDEEDRTPDNNLTAVCPSLPVKSHRSIFHRCVPEALIDHGQSIFNAAGAAVASVLDSYVINQCENSGTLLDHIANDLQNTYIDILKLIGVSAVVSLVVVLLMRFLAGIFVWLMVIGMAVCACGGAAYAWYIYLGYKDDLDAIPEAEQEQEEKDYVRNWFIGAIAGSAVAAIVLLVLLIMRKRIALVVQLFREAGKAMAAMPALMLQPLWTVIALFIALGVLSYGYLYVFTAELPVVDNSTGVVTYEDDKILFYMKWYYLFGIFWMVEFIFACQIMIIAGAVSIWYFTRDKNSLGCCQSKSPICTAIGRLLGCHLGSVALGSFIIALVRFVRAILMYIERQLKGKTTKVAQYILRILACCMCCLEKVLKVFTNNAYIMIAIYGCNLCTGGRRAAVTLLNNILRVGALNSVGAFTLFLGKIGVVTLVLVGGFQLFKDRTDICYLYVPMIISGVGAFFVADCFLGVYGMAIDTIFLCFCVDSDVNDGVSKPYFMGKSLMKFVDNSAEALREMTRDADDNNNTVKLNNKRVVTTPHGPKDDVAIEWV